MDKTLLITCLQLLASVKRDLILSPMVESAWHFCLKELPNELGRSAFGALMKRTTYGAVEPAHILEIAQELETRRAMDRGGEHAWIDTAKPFAGQVNYDNPSESFKTWLSLERARLYRSIDSKTQEIMLIRNPSAWDWRVEDGIRIFIRPAPIPTGQKAGEAPSSPKETKKASGYRKG